MLVLARKLHESIRIGDEIEISVVEIKGDQVRLGIKAPSRVAVHRQEVYEAIQRENLNAAETEPSRVPSLAEAFNKSPDAASTKPERGEGPSPEPGDAPNASVRGAARRGKTSGKHKR